LSNSASALGAPNILEVTSLSISFGRTQVLRNVSFRVAAGSSLAVIGPNGSGKTVLFRALVGAIPFEGTIRWADGVRIGYVPQKLDLERDVPITGVDFLAAHPRASPGMLNEMLALVGLPRAVAGQPIGALSGGQFQRLLIAFALIGEPSVLLLDEPTAGVDEPGEERLNALVARLQRERRMTTLLISHELAIVFRDATNVLCLSGDRTWFGPPKQILTPELLLEVYGMPVAFHVHEP
jgi:zinc transport system ATP-binding protein